MRQFFACSVGQPGEGYDEENLSRIISGCGFYLHEDTIQKGLYFEIKKGDILILKYRSHFIAFGEAIGLSTEKNENGWNLCAPVKEWFFYNSSNHQAGVTSYGIQYATQEGSGQMATVKLLTDGFAVQKIAEIGIGSLLLNEILLEIQKQTDDKKMEKIKSLLEYKKQIILQGAPGTGKTRLAKTLAKEMTKSKNLGSPMEKINQFFEKNKIASQETISKRDKIKADLGEFHSKFPKDQLRSLSLDTYTFGNGENGSFCWWIEYGLWELGGYSGQAAKFKIFWKKDSDAYAKSGFIKGEADDEKAMQLVAEQVSNAAHEIKLQEAVDKLSKGFVLKIAHSYNPELYFPVNNEKCIDNILKLLGIDAQGQNIFDKNKRVQTAFCSIRDQFSADVTNIEFMRFLFANFDVKGEIALMSNDIVGTGSYKIIQFHPSYAYEDFVRGINVEINEQNQAEYTVADKVLSEFAQEALDHPSGNYVLIIDEINRANLSSVLGELIYALEYRYDESREAETTVESVYAKQVEGDIRGDRSLRLPRNLYIIGTMNTADRSVGQIDYAIRRRFAFVDVLPTALKDNFDARKFTEVSRLFISNIDDYISNEKTALVKSEHLSEEFRPEDVWLGHSYFITEDVDIAVRLEYEIVPILKEYIRDGILKASAKDIVDKLLPCLN